MKRTLRTKIWCAVLVVACVSGVAFGVANLPRVQAEAVSGGVEVTEAPGNEAVVSEESKAEVPEISENPEIFEVSETAEVSSAKEEFESHFTADEKLDFSKIPKIVRTEDGSISIENGDGSFDAENDPYFSASSIYGGKNVKVTIKDVHMSNKLEYGLTPADNDCFVPWWINGGYPWLETCELNEDGTLSSPHYAFAYVTIGFENTGDEATGFLSGAYAMGQYDTDGCPLDMSECTTDKRELINGIAEVPMNAEDPNKTGNILLEPGQTRELVFIYLLSDESVYVRTDDEAAERDGVKNYIEIVENYFIDAYTETDCRYTIDVNSGLGPFVQHKLIPPRTPWHNGKVERSHRNDRRYFYNWEKFASAEDLNRKLKDHLRWSNRKPMRTLGGKSPLDLLREILSNA